MFGFGIQLYCDFSGYSDMAIGLSNLLGIRLCANFRTPYFATSLPDLWRRWHISLSEWFRDYLFIPLGGSRGSQIITCRNLMIVFVVSGLWHGAGWSYAVWGLLHALGIVLCFIWKQKKYSQRLAIPPRVLSGGGWILTQTFWLVALVCFRGENKAQILAFLEGLILRSWDWNQMDPHWILLAGGIFLYGAEWIQRDRPHVLDLHDRPLWIRWTIYLICCLCFLTYGSFESRAFVYFQF